MAFRMATYTVLVVVSLLEVAAVEPWTSLYRVPIPEQLPPHPRVFCTAADLARISADAARGDAYTMACREQIVAAAENALPGNVPAIKGQPSRSLLSNAAALAQAYAMTEEERFAGMARTILLAVSRAAMTLKRTPAAGLLTSSTLAEGPAAVDFAMGYDLVANSATFSAEDHDVICTALRRVAWEAGHSCHHRDSSNWRSWALCVLASCGFASGDRQLIDEAINGAWDRERGCYLYGVVQQLTHSVFSDGVHWERCMGYTYYTGSALMYVMVAAANSGIDLWHAELPGILGPFEGGAPHEEYGPAGPRSIKAFLDAPFYYAFPGGGFARVGDSGTRTIAYHPLYELAWLEYRDPKYAWLIRRERDGRGRDAPARWQMWVARGKPTWTLDGEGTPDGSTALHLTTGEDDRVAAVQDVTCPGDQTLIVTGRIRALTMGGGKAHIRCNLGKQAYFTDSVTAAGDWREVRVEIPAGKEAIPRRVRLHVFLEGGAGDVLWESIQARCAADAANLVYNGGFDAGLVDGRRLDFWSLVNGIAAVPEGEYDLGRDATIGLKGTHINGCTLFPVGGYAILRDRPNDPEALAVNLSFGPYGSGHDHPDRLTITVHALGQTLCPDAGSWGYENPMHLSWANQTVAHNTVTLDERAQEPQGLSTSIWAGERGEQRVFGTLQLFHPGEHLKAVRATCDTAYPGTLLDRTVCLVGGRLVDIFRVSAAADQIIDLPLHGRGEVTADGVVIAPEKTPFSGMGYGHFEQLRQREPGTGIVRAVFTEQDRRMRVLQALPSGSEVFLAQDPKRAGELTSCLLARYRGREATLVTVLAPERHDSTVRNLVVRPGSEALVIEVLHADGTDRLISAHAAHGGIRLERLNTGGEIVAVEEAVAGEVR